MSLLATFSVTAEERWEPVGENRYYAVLMFGERRVFEWEIEWIDREKGREVEIVADRLRDLFTDVAALKAQVAGLAGDLTAARGEAR